MSKTALFVRHRVQPGRRDEFWRIWDQHVRPRAQANPAHDAYYFCFDDSDPDVVCVFQLYRSKEDMQDFLSGDWYPNYLEEIMLVVAAPPELTSASLIWSKEAPSAGL